MLLGSIRLTDSSIRALCVHRRWEAYVMRGQIEHEEGWETGRPSVHAHMHMHTCTFVTLMLTSPEPFVTLMITSPGPYVTLMLPSCSPTLD